MLQHFISRRSLRAFTPQVLNTHSLEFKNCASTFAFWRRYTTLQCNEIITKAFNPANSNKFMVLNGGLPHVTVAGGLPNRKFLSYLQYKSMYSQETLAEIPLC